MPDCQVWVVQRLLASNTFGRIEIKQLGEEIDCKRIRPREQSGERDFGLDGQGTNVILSLRERKL